MTAKFSLTVDVKATETISAVARNVLQLAKVNFSISSVESVVNSRASLMDQIYLASLYCNLKFKCLNKIGFSLLHSYSLLMVSFLCK